MTQAFVLGNGISRQGIDLDQLRTHGPIYGCNALYREFTPDVLVATDRPIATEIQTSGYARTNKFYTRKPVPDSGALPLPSQYKGFSSGPNACGLAALDGHCHIYLLGFDMGPTLEQQFNNVYANTEFYKTSAHPPTFTGNWVRQLVTVARDFPTTNFIRLTGPTTAHIVELEKIDTFDHQDLALFISSINTISNA
jgi:hypothetical protein